MKSDHSFPHVIRIEPSSLCNLKCIHCPTGTRRDLKKGNMSNEVFNKIIEEIKTHTNVDKIVLYHGGEPFLNKNIFEMISMLKSIGINFVKTVTNGMLLNYEMLLKIIESRLDSIEFSLDGLSPEENNQIRKNGNYHQVASVIKELLSMKIKLGTIKPDVYIANTQIPSRKQIEKRIKVSTPQYILNDFSDFEGSIGFKSMYMIKWPGLNCFNNYDLIEMPTVEDLHSPNYCDHIVSTITIRWNGDIVPCCYDIASNYVIGNIMKQSLFEIWNNKKYRQLYKSIHLRKYFPLCNECKAIKPQLFVVKGNNNATL